MKKWIWVIIIPGAILVVFLIWRSVDHPKNNKKSLSDKKDSTEHSVAKVLNNAAKRASLRDTCATAEKPIGKIIVDAVKNDIVPGIDSVFTPLGEKIDTVVTVTEPLSEVDSLKQRVSVLERKVAKLEKQKRSRYRKTRYTLGW